MRSYRSPELIEMLQGGSFSVRLIVDAFNGATRTHFDLGVADWDLRWNREANLKSSGSVTLLEVDDYGRSIVPVLPGDDLSAFGSELNILMEVSAESFSETVQLGHYRIGEVPETEDAYADFGDRQIVAASMVVIELDDRLAAVEKRGFAAEENPASTSAWAELARVSGMQVIRSLPDVTIPSDFVYQAVQGGRLKGVRALAALLGGVEYTTPDGALSVLSLTPGAPVGTLRLGEDGVILGDTGGMKSRDVANVIIGDFETDERLPIHVTARAVGAYSPEAIGERTKYVTSTLVRTAESAQAFVDAELAVSARPAQRITVEAIVNPLVELGDVWNVEREDGTTVAAQVATIAFSSRSPGRMRMEMDVV